MVSTKNTLPAALTILIMMVVVILAGSCGKKTAGDEATEGPAESEKVATLRKEVIAVHDEVMPLMSDIYNLKNSLRERLDAAPQDAKAEIETVLAELDSADQGMRVWMREFSKLQTEGMAEDDALAVLGTEMKKITKVKEDMVFVCEQGEVTSITGPHSRDRPFTIVN